jgi:hypothetical protein
LEGLAFGFADGVDISNLVGLSGCLVVLVVEARFFAGFFVALDCVAFSLPEKFSEK